ncbi:hypothetical protein BN1211_3749 [Cyberlindnera jadinii]|uniref:VPS10 domain-containing protein n=1 Tax=Cyberlindnera jadinii (strain ATCC 18201 / CBS 1600 / BCRC 20928 / JCM 3617 / NBRC 0987 / NRRL Y-1542) TaxID=983966 RepID=A0A0H5C5G7_CYBJN|nr:hypothetical protein BN1211_3749 [Cyberlindnera jadinii]
MQLCSISLLVLLLHCVNAIFEPKISSTQFSGAPELVYFEDTDNVLYLDQSAGDVYLSKDGGAKFSKVDFEGVKIKYLIEHPYKHGFAYAISDDTTHFKTVSQGVTWKKFTTPHKPATDSVESLGSKHSPIIFHGKRSDYALFAGACASGSEICQRQYYYTRDNFDEMRIMTTAYSCIFSDATPFTEAKDTNTVTCIIPGEGASVTNVLAKSDDWFASKQYLTYQGGMITDVSKLGAGSHSLVALGAHLSDSESTYVYVSYDGSNWQRVEFPAGTPLSGTFSVVEGTQYSIFVDVKYANTDKVGQLFFSSGLNGSYFVQSLEFTHRDAQGVVDYELVESIDGIVLANTVSNGKDVINNNSNPVVKSKISFDQGVSWSNMQVTDGNCVGSCDLHLHSLVHRASVDPNAPGKYFSSPAPGILLGVGNTGDSLKSYEEGDTFISLDAGKSWSRTLVGAHLFEFGDQGSIIVAVEDGSDTNVIKYSSNMGQTWQQVGLGATVKAKTLTTTPDSTTSKFLLVGSVNGQYNTYSLDFSDLYSRKCEDGDFEDWYVKSLNSNEPMCILGHQQKFKRRVRNANCKVANNFKEPVAVEDACPCTQSDFVCAVNFKRDSNGNCIPATNAASDQSAKDAQCINNAQYYTPFAAYSKRPGSVCSTSTGIDLSRTNQKVCPNYQEESGSGGHKTIDYDEDDRPDETEPDTNPGESEGDKQKSNEGVNDGRVKTSSFAFSGKIRKYVYLERVPGSNLRDETIVLVTEHNVAYVTHDQGSSWEEIAPGEEILDIFVNPHNTDHVYLLSVNHKIIYSTDRADNWKFFRTPANYIPGVTPLQFHPKHSNWFIYIGQQGCDSDSLTGTCRTVTYYTLSYGKRFKKMKEQVNTCQFIGHLLEPTDENLIICVREDNEHTTHSAEMLVSTDFFQTSNTPLKDVIGFVQEDDYLVAATAEADGSLKAHVSVNGRDWTDALFPANIRVDKQQAYTVLSAMSQAIFLHVTTNQRSGTEYGHLLKSNSNGTSYVMSNEYVNRDVYGYVDFEQLENLEGVAVINTVANPIEAKRGAKKQLKTKITHNDGADWDFMQPPSVDSNGKKYDCSGKSINDCSLHLHGYTERADYRDTFSSGSAVGMMIGVGNVGDKLGLYLDGNTFMTRDGGNTWKEIKKGVYQWEYGDQGSIIVLVNAEDSTNTLAYSLDEGATWNDYQFTEHKVKVQDISTVPSDDSRKFLLFTRLPSNLGDKSTVYQIDFSQLFKRKCNLDLANPDDDDFDLWTPKHPHQADDCLFGHVSQYYRKIPGKECYIGEKLDKPYEVVRECACTRQDYECDFNYFRDRNGECRLVPGYTPPDHSTVCQELGVDEYWLPTGYRRIPLTKCKGGHEFDKIEPVACPGKEEEFKRKHKGLTGLSLALVIVIPIIGVAVVLYVIYHHYVGRYGQIKLGEDQEYEFDNSSFLNKVSSMVGFAVVASVQLIEQIGSPVINGMTGIFQLIKERVSGRSVSLDSTTLDTGSYDDLGREPAQHTEVEDADLLDDGDLTEAEDERL